MNFSISVSGTKTIDMFMKLQVVHRYRRQGQDRERTE